jgi:hypothetical protein
VRVSKGVAVVAVFACLSVAVAACGSGGGGETAAQVPANPAGKAEVANFHGIESGELELALEIDRYKKHPEEINMRILGSFMGVGEEDPPSLDMAIESNGNLAGHDVEFLSGPLIRPEKAVVNFAGKVYEPDKATFKELKSKFEAAQQEDGGEGNAMACVEAAQSFNLTEVVHHVSFEGKGETLDGVKVETVGGDLDPAAVIGELITVTEESPGCKAQLEAVGLPPAAQLEELQKELTNSLTAARLTLSIDKHGVVRYFKILANDELPRGEELEVELVMRLSRVNEVTELSNTHGYSPFPALLKQFGLSEQDVKQAEAGKIYVGVLGVLADRLFGSGNG